MESLQNRSSSGSELQRLKVLQAIAEHLNRTLELQPMLDTTLPLILKLVGLDIGWVLLRDEAGHFYTAAGHGLPPALEAEERAALQWSACHCQRLLLAGELSEAVNIVRCERLERARQALQAQGADAEAQLGGLQVHASIPLRVGDQVLGILNLARAEDGALSQVELALLSTVGETLGAAIHRARLHEDLKTQRVQEQEILLRLSQELAGLTDPQAVMDVAARTVQEALQVDYVSLMEPDPEGQRLVLVGGAGWEPEMLGRYRLDIETSREGHVFRTGEPVQQPDVQSDQPFPCPVALRERGVVSSTTVPLRGKQEILGTLCVHSTRPRQFSPDEMRLLSLIANQVAIALDRAWEHRAVKEAEVRYRSLFDGVPVGLYRSTMDGQILDANLALVQILGYPDRESLLRVNTTQLYADPKEREQWCALIEQQGIVRDFEARFRRADGTIIWARDTAHAVRDADGQVLFIEGSLEDVTARKEAEATRRWAEQRYRQLFEEAPVMYVITRNREGVPFIEDCNQAFLKTLGYLREEVIGRPLGDFYTPASRQALLEDGGYQQALRSEFVIDERQLATRDGRVIETLLRAVPETDTEGRVIGTRAMYVDVTALREAERSLRRERDRLAAQSRILAGTLRLTDLDELLNLVLDEALGFLAVEFGGIHLVQGDQVLLRAWRGISDEFRAHVRAFPSENPPAWMQEPGVVHERLSELGRTPGFAKREGVQAWAAVSLYRPSQGGEEEWLGTLMVGSRRYDALDETDVRALQDMGNQLALAIDRLRTFRQAQERLARLQTLREIDRAIIQSLDLEAVLHVVLERVPRELGAEAVAISLLDERRERFEVFTMRLPNGTLIHEAAFNIADNLLHWFMEHQEPVIIYDLAQDPRVQMHREHIRDGRLVSYLGVPLVVREQTIGILHILTTQPRVFADEDVAFFRTLAGQAAVAIENARAFAETIQRAEAVENMLAAQVEIASAEPEQMAQVILTSLCQAVKAERAGFFRYDDRTQSLSLVDAVGFPREVIDEVRPHLVFRLGEERGLVGLVALTPQPLYLPDCHADPRWVPLDPTIRAAYLLPLTFGERLFGVVNLVATKSHAFPQHQRALADLFAHYAAAVLEGGRLLAETRRRAAHLEALNTIVAVAAAATDLPSLLETVLERTLDALGLEMGAIWVRHVSPPLLVLRGLPSEIRPAVIQTLQAAGMDLDRLEVREPISIDDWQQVGDSDLEQALGPLMERFGIRASLIAPITTEGRRIGGLSVGAPHPHVWMPEEIALAEAIGQELGAAAARLRLFQEAQQRAERMAHLAILGESLNRPFTVAEVAEAIGQGALALSGADRAAVYLREPDESATCLWSHGLSPEYLAQVTARIREMPGGQLLYRSDPVLISDVAGLPGEAPVRRLAQQEGYRAVALWPLIYEGRVIAAVGCYHDLPHTWSAVEQEAMQTLSRQAAIALENARLFESLQTRLHELSTLAEVSTALRSAATVQEMGPVLANEVVRLIRADAAFVCLLDEEREQIITLAATGVPTDAIGRTHGAREGVTGYVVQTGAVYRSPDLATDPLVVHRDLAIDLGPSVCVPLQTTEGQVIGTLLVARRRQPKSEARPIHHAEERLLTTLAEIAGNALQRAWTFEELEESYVQTVLALANAVDARDTYTADHSQRLAAWAEATAQELGCGEEEIRAIRWGALLHDIGKIAVPDEVLRKPGELTDEEWEIIKRHPEIGAQIVTPIRKLADVVPIIRAHQEKFDGSGYPDGLQEDEIPLGARILTVVDAYSAITDERPYKPARPHAEAVAELRRCAGSQFDPQVVEAFLRVLERGVDITGGGEGVNCATHHL